MNLNRVCLLGGSGFVGRQVVYRLAAKGIRTRVLTRQPHRLQHLAQTGCEMVRSDLFDHKRLTRDLAGCDAVVNLIGILNETRSASFRRIHVDLVDALVAACHEAKVTRLLHMSALNADTANGGSQYLRSKGEGENRAHTRGHANIAVTSFRPSVIFGPEDSFINRFATLLQLPGPLPLACPDARFAPVYVGDVADAFVKSLSNRSSFGKRFELCGPTVYTLFEIVTYIADTLRCPKRILRMPDRLSHLQARIMEHVPGKPFTVDNYLSMRLPNLCSDDGLAQLGIHATAMEAIVPQFLNAENRRGQLRMLRRRHG